MCIEILHSISNASHRRRRSTIRLTFMAFVFAECLFLTGCGIAESARPAPHVLAAHGQVELTLMNELGSGTLLTEVGGTSNYSIGDIAAVAARGADLYAIDRQKGALMKIDVALREAQRIAMLSNPDTRGLHVTHDGIVYVVDRFDRSVRQFDESGYYRQSFRDAQMLAAPVDVTVVEFGSQVAVADELDNQIVIFNSLGSVTSLLGDRFRSVVVTQSINAIAATDRGLMVADPSMAEVMELDLSGRLLASYGEVDLRRPLAVATDECGRIYVIDLDGLFTSGPATVTEPARHELPGGFGGAVADLWFDNNVLYIAAGVYGIRMYSVDPPCFGG